MHRASDRQETTLHVIAYTLYTIYTIKSIFGFIIKYKAEATPMLGVR